MNADYLVTLGSTGNATEEASKSTKLKFNPSSGLTFCYGSFRNFRQENTYSIL